MIWVIYSSNFRGVWWSRGIWFSFCPPIIWVVTSTQVYTEIYRNILQSYTYIGISYIYIICRFHRYLLVTSPHSWLPGANATVFIEPWKGTILKGIWSSNHRFSGDMLVFRGVGWWIYDVYIFTPLQNQDSHGKGNFTSKSAWEGLCLIS